MKAKSISLIIILFLIIQLIFPILTATQVLATTSGDWEYTLNEDGETITLNSYSGYKEITEDGTLLVPSEIDGYTVTEFFSNSSGAAFKFKNLIKHIEFPDTIKTITGPVCSSCDKLESIKFPENLESITGYAFTGCTSLESIVLPNTVKTISAEAFRGCENLEEINIPANTKFKIDAQDRWNCNSPFGKCYELVIKLDTNNSYYTYEDGVLFNKDKTELIYYSGKKTNTTYSIPNSVEFVYDGAFSNKYLEEIFISENVEFVAFINPIFFDNCNKLKAITVSEDSTHYSSQDGILYNKNKKELLDYPKSKKDLIYTIPDTLISCNNLKSEYLTTIRIENNTNNFIN